MKSILILLSAVALCFNSYRANAQKTYFSLKVSAHFGGTPLKIKSSMKASHFDFNTHSFLGADAQSYPYSSTAPSVVAEWGKYINEGLSFAILGGLQEAGSVSGYSSSCGGIEIDFTNWILNPKLNWHKKSAILGIGASA